MSNRQWRLAVMVPTNSTPNLVNFNLTPNWLQVDLKLTTLLVLTPSTHPPGEKPIVVQNFSSQAYQFSEENVSEQLNLFSRFTAAGTSKMFPEHLLHAVQCTASDQSPIALRVLTKLVHISCRGELPEFVSQALCSASLSALLKKKGGICSIAVGEVLRRLIAKFLAKEANSEAKELFQSLQLGVGVKGGAEAIIHPTKLSYEKILTLSSSSGILQIDFCNAFNSKKRSESRCQFNAWHCRFYQLLLFTTQPIILWQTFC